jgi:Family of unknown function (DUF5317)
VVNTALLLGTPAVVGVVVGYLCGGRLAALGRSRLRALWLLWTAAAVQVAQLFVPPLARFIEHRLHLSMLVVVFGFVAAWLIVNMRGRHLSARLALVTICVGSTLNGFALAFNDWRMPYDRAAAAQAGLPGVLETPKNFPESGTTRLAGLGDIIAIPPTHKVVSIGDLMIAAGAAVLIAALMKIHPRSSAPKPDIEDVVSM